MPTPMRHGSPVNKMPEYKPWRSMRRRCYSPSYEYFHLYGGRGISVCEQWRNSFDKFLADMGPRPPGTSLDRYPNKDGNYEPGNCRWATPAQQSANTNLNALFTLRSETFHLAEWARRSGLKMTTLQARLSKGADLETALTAPLQPGRRKCLKAN